MKKKLSFSIIAIVCAALLFYGVSAFANASATSGSSTTVAGTVAAVSEEKAVLQLMTDQGEQTVAIAKSVWVYRNEQKAQLSDLKAGDRVEIVLNSKKQAAYIKSFTQQAGSTGSGSSASPTATPSPAPSATPAPTTKPSPSVSAGSSSPRVATPTPSASPGLEGLEVMIDGKHFKLELKQNPGKGETKYELNVKPENGGTVHLKGEAAAEWIALLLGSVDLKSADARQQLVAVIARHYGLDAGKLNVSVNGSLQNAARANAGVEKDDDDERDDDHGRGYVKSSKQDDKGKNGKHEKD